MKLLAFLGMLTAVLLFRRPEARALLVWWVDSWIRPPDTDSNWEQK